MTNVMAKRAKGKYFAWNVMMYTETLLLGLSWENVYAKARIKG